MIGRFRTVGSVVTLSTTSSQVQRKRKPSQSGATLIEGSYGILIIKSHLD